MAIFSQISRIARLPEFDTTLESGYRRQRKMRVEVFLHREAWGSFDPDTFLADDRLPALYSPYPAVPYPETRTNFSAPFVVYDEACLLQTARVQQVNTFNSIIYEYIYDTNPGTPAGYFPQDLRRDGGAAGGGEGRVDIGFRFSFGNEDFPLAYTYDGSADPDCYEIPPDDIPVPEAFYVAKIVRNTAGDRYDSQPIRNIPIRVLTVVRMELNYQLRYWNRWSYVKNLFEWNGNAPGTVLSFPVQIGEWQEYGGRLLFPVTYTFRWLDTTNIPTGMEPNLSPETFWDDVIESFGWQQLVNDTLTRISGKGGVTISSAQPLDADGKWINPPGSAPVATTTYLKYRYRDFEELEIELPEDESTD